MLNPPTQYATDENLRARQRLWAHQDEPSDLHGWVIDLAGVRPGHRLLDLGCGNGEYLRRLAPTGAEAVGCDLSLGMLGSVPRPAGERLVNGDAQRLPFATDAFDVVLAPHMLYHVPDRPAAAHELRRVLRAGGTCVAVTNGAGHLRALRELVEASVRRVTPEWEMRNPSTHAFSLENGDRPLADAFASVEVVRPGRPATVRLTDAATAADYVASVADHYQPETDRPWAEVVADVRRSVQATIDADGSFLVGGDTGAFVCS